MISSDENIWLYGVEVKDMFVLDLVITFTKQIWNIRQLPGVFERKKLFDLK